MSTKVVDYPAILAEPMGNPPVVRDVSVTGGRAAAAVLAPSVAVLGALAVHLVIPNKQLAMPWVDSLPPAEHPYPVLLYGILTASLLLAVLQLVIRPLQPWVRHRAPLVAGAVFLFTLWDTITLKLNWMELLYFPGPNMVLARMVDDRIWLLESTWHSLRLLLTGYLAGVTVGIVTGVLIGWFRHVRYWGMPVLKFIGPIPATALVPLAMTIPADLFYSGAALIAFAVWFPVTMLTSSGIANVRLSYLDVARTLGAGRLYLIFRVAIPAALPNIFLGLFMGLGVSFLTLIVAETVGVNAGLGAYLDTQKSAAKYSGVFAALIIMAVFFSGLMTLLFKIRDWVLTWQKGVIKW